jgi:VanZ family protein
MPVASGARRNTAPPLALAWVGLTIYATLYPFAGWLWPPGATLGNLLLLPWPRWYQRFDMLANLLAYMPLGALLYTAAVRQRARPLAGLGLALAVGALGSYGLEVLQQFLPQRVPSALDWLLNSLGALAGAVLAAVLHASGALARLRGALQRWFPERGAGLLLLLLWPVGLLFPAPVPLALGQLGGWLAERAQELTADTPWADAAIDALAAWAAAQEPLGPASEWLAVALGLLAPCLLAYAMTRPGWRRVVLALGAAVLALAVTTLSTALNFGPDHALAWRTPVTLPALLSGLAAALLLVPVGPRLAAGLGLVAVTGLVALVAQAPADPYFAQSLHGWEQGRFIRFHGVAQWVGWLWPYAAIVVLLGHVGRAR